MTAMVKGFGRRTNTTGPAFESLPRRKSRAGKGDGAVRTIYGELRIADCRRRALEVPVDRVFAVFRDLMADVATLT
jgi:hypothetical protein